MFVLKDEAEGIYISIYVNRGISVAMWEDGQPLNKHHMYISDIDKLKLMKEVIEQAIKESE